MSSSRFSLFVPHGSPMFALDPGQAGAAMSRIATQFEEPRAIVIISPHWLTERPAVSVSTQLETIHDFYGFDRALYEMQYPAAGCPEAAEVVKGTPFAQNGPGPGGVIGPDLSSIGAQRNLNAIRDKPDGTRRAVGRDGVTRIIAYHTDPKTGWVTWAGVPERTRSVTGSIEVMERTFSRQPVGVAAGRLAATVRSRPGSWGTGTPGGDKPSAPQGNTFTSPPAPEPRAD